MSTQERQAQKDWGVNRPQMPKATRLRAGQPVDPNLARYCWSALLPVDLRQQGGSRYIGPFTDEEGRECLQARQLTQLIGQKALGVMELPAIHGSIADMQTNHFSGFDANEEVAGGQTFRQSPLLIAYQLMRDYERTGLCLFEGAAGMDFDELFHIFSGVLPYEVFLDDNGELTTRTVLGHTFRGPFLDEIRGYVKRISIADAQGNAKTVTDKRVAQHLLIELRMASDRGWKTANSTLNASESQIRKFQNGKLGKEYYDTPDERFADAPTPLDLICLAETGRTPINEQALAAAEALSRRTQDSVVEGMKQAGKEMAAAFQQQPQAAGITLKDVEQMLDARERARDAYWAGEIAKLQAGAAVTPMETAPIAAEPGASKHGQSNQKQQS